MTLLTHHYFTFFLFYIYCQTSPFIYPTKHFLPILPNILQIHHTKSNLLCTISMVPSHSLSFSISVTHSSATHSLNSFITLSIYTINNHVINIKPFTTDIFGAVHGPSPYTSIHLILFRSLIIISYIINNYHRVFLLNLVYAFCKFSDSFASL